ncbi:MAG: YihY/virulence factor BrkB family protein [Saprospiraceae bacterium]|nr:YihY/virulence factor BrkB family protein [Saprospiraceae bacterium]
MKKIFQHINDYFTKHPLWESLIDWAKVRTLPGFYGMSIYAVIQFLLKEIKREAIVTRANSMSFSFFLSLFPTLLVIFSLLAYVPFIKKKDTQRVVKESIREIMPGDTGKMLDKTVVDIMNRPRSGLLTFSFALTIFFASNGMMALMRGFEKKHLSQFQNRTGLQKRIIAIQLTFLLGGLLLASVTFVILGNTLFNFLAKLLHISVLAKYAVMVFRWAAIFVVFSAGISLIYRYGSALEKRMPIVNAGATFATFASLTTSIVFQYYIDNFSQYNKIYGAIGSLIVLLLWIQINSFILIVGFELNASIAVNQILTAERKLKKSEVA